METIQMVDLKRRYARLRSEIEQATADVVASGTFIGGPEVDSFSRELGQYLGTPHVIPCANGTDALELALRALDVRPGDEVIMPAFTYIAAAEMVALLGATPVLVDVRPDTYNIDPALIEQAVSRQTKAIVVVHLFGQACDMDPILRVATKYKLGVIEDNAQSLGADHTSADGRTRKAGTIARIGTTSFFPTKPLACCGDGGALFTADNATAERLRLLANHGQVAKYEHHDVGRNSRLDALQAAILRVNLRHIDDDISRRRAVADRYDEAFGRLPWLRLPVRSKFSTHVFHQYTLRVSDGRRDALRDALRTRGIPSTVYYPRAIHEQEAYKWVARTCGSMAEAVRLSRDVLSLPIHADMTDQEVTLIIDRVKAFFEK